MAKNLVIYYSRRGENYFGGSKGEQSGVVF